jgi:hypothetical protein
VRGAEAPQEAYKMTFIVLESGAIMLTLLTGWEMRRQQVSWQRVLVRSLIQIGILTGMILMWRGHG